MRTRATLETAIQRWLNRETADIQARVPDFITLAEVRIFSRLRCRFNENSVLGQTPVNARIPLPADFAQVKTLEFGTGLRYKSDQRYNRRTNVEITGNAEYFTRIGNEFVIWPYPDGSTDEADLWYYQKQVLGTNANDTTPVLTASPGLYLFGSLLEAEPYLKYTDNVPLWQGKYNQTFDELSDDTWESEFAGSTNQVESVYSDVGGYHAR